MTAPIPKPRPIDAMIVGAQKAGTSSLAFYLGQHPQICTHDRLELSYFVDDQDYDLGYEANFDRYFKHCDRESVLLGKSVTVMTDPHLVERMHQHNPSLRAIVILRNPADRAYSAYWWARRSGYETLRSFEEAIGADPARHDGNRAKVRNTSYLQFGEYARQLQNLFDTVGREHVQVHLFEDLTSNAHGVCKLAFDFLGVDQEFLPSVVARRNTSALPRSTMLARALTAKLAFKRRIRDALPRGAAETLKRRVERWNRVSFVAPSMNFSTRRRLVAHFAPHNDRLGALIGRDLAAWSDIDLRSETDLVDY